MAEVKVPDIGDFTDVPVIEILVSEGDEVAAEDPLVTLESDKATMDVPSPEAGTISEILVSVGDKVSEGTPIAVIGEGGGDEASEGSGEEESESGEDTDEEEDESGADEDEGTDDDEGAADDEGAENDDRPPAPEGERKPTPRPASDTVYASPSVRRLARERGIDLGRVQGTGRKGRITTDDVERFEDEGEAGAALPGLDLAPWPTVDFEKYGPVERVELSRIKRISGPNLARNWVYIPHVTQFDEADITDLEAFRKELNSEQDVKVTILALLLKACVASLREYPDFNASLDGQGGLVRKLYYHLGFAADTPQGLLVPVIRDVDKKGVLEVAAEIIELSGKAREGKIGPGEMAGSTFTISSLGGVGGTAFTPIINAPELAILGVSRSAMKPVWNGSDFEPRLMLPLSLSYDHRVIDGAAAARFTTHLAGVLADLKRALL